MSEKPIERLNYYNGQRLEAADLQLEQDYQIRVRRWLNRSLYAAGGIAQGLTVQTGTVTEGKTEKPVILVGPGLALDAAGREIILVAAKSLELPGERDTYLTIEYDEQKTEQETGSCTVGTKTRRNSGDRVAWGGPARILADPKLNFYPQLPPDSSGKIVLAKVALSADGNSVSLDTSLRRYIGAASATKVNQYALDGERQIDQNNPGKIYFHIRGRQPNAVTLYLRAESFPTLYYTELGGHVHSFDLDLTGGSHRHSLGCNDVYLGTAYAFVSVEDTGDVHVKDYWQQKENDAKEPVKIGDTIDSFGLVVSPRYKVYWINPDGTQLEMAGLSPRGTQADILTVDDSKSEHEHAVRDKEVSHEGVNFTGRSGNPLAYVKELTVSIGKIDRQSGDAALTNCTDDILQQLANADPDWAGMTLGNGAKGHPFVAKGTGPIKLDFLPGLSFNELDGGEYVIVLSVSGDGNGGRILYNLYVE